MDMPVNRLCMICKEQDSKYTCPKCEILYCSLECYKSESHLDCSEDFYKKWVEDELQLNESDPESRQKMINILQRMKTEMEDDPVKHILDDSLEEDELLDSDDENVEELEKRLNGVNLDNPDELWNALTDAEKQEFESLVKSQTSSNLNELIPQWEPWWLFHENNKLIEELELDKSFSYVEKCPPIVQVTQFKELMKSSPYVKYNIENVLYAYVYTTLHFNGEHMHNHLESALIFIDLCDNMRINKVFNNSESGSESVMERLISSNVLPVQEQTLFTLKQAVEFIHRGPAENNKSFYITACLSDLHNLFSKIKLDKSTLKIKALKTDFSRKFPELSEIMKRTQLSKRVAQLSIKKLEYYLSWTNFYMDKSMEI